MRSPDLEIQELDLSKEVAQKWTGFTPFLSSPPFLCYGVYFDFSQQLFTKSEVFCKYSTQTGFHKILKKYKVPVCRDSKSKMKTTNLDEVGRSVEAASCRLCMPNFS